MSPQPKLSPLISIKEAAQRLAVSVKTVRRMIKRGDLKVYRMCRDIRISEDDLIVFAARNYG